MAGPSMTWRGRLLTNDINVESGLSFRRSGNRDPAFKYYEQANPEEVRRFRERLCDQDLPKELRIVFIGKTGSGKSSTANMMAGRKVYRMGFTPKSCTQTIEECDIWLNDHCLIKMIDTPGLYDTSRSEEDVKLELAKVLTCFPDGIHAFVIVVEAGKETEEERKTLKKWEEFFGVEVMRHSVVILSKANFLEEMSVTEWVAESDHIARFIHDANNRVTCLKDSIYDEETDGPTVLLRRSCVLSLIAKCLHDNRGKIYTSRTFAIAKARAARAEAERKREDEDRVTKAIAEEKQKAAKAEQRLRARIEEIKRQAEEEKNLADAREKKAAEEKRMAEIAERMRQAEIDQQRMNAAVAEANMKAQMAEDQRRAQMVIANRNAEIAEARRQAEVAEAQLKAQLEAEKRMHEERVKMMTAALTDIGQKVPKVVRNLLLTYKVTDFIRLSKIEFCQEQLNQMTNATWQELEEVSKDYLLNDQRNLMSHIVPEATRQAQQIWENMGTGQTIVWAFKAFFTGSW